MISLLPHPMKPVAFSVRRCRPAGLAAALLVCCLGLSALAGELKLEAQLIWGTNDPKSPDPRHKPVEEQVARKLKELPFKWTHYFEVNRKEFTVTRQEPRKVTLSEECEIRVRQLEDEQVELTLYGRGKRVGRISQKLPKSEMLVLGGNAPNYTAWFVVLRRKD